LQGLRVALRWDHSGLSRSHSGGDSRRWQVELDKRSLLRGPRFSVRATQSWSRLAKGFDFNVNTLIYGRVRAARTDCTIFPDACQLVWPGMVSRPGHLASWIQVQPMLTARSLSASDQCR
jgi:hypothetical protein